MKLVDPSQPQFEQYWRLLLRDHTTPSALLTDLYFKYRAEYLEKSLVRQIRFLIVDGDIPLLGSELDLLTDEYGELSLDASLAPSAVILGQEVGRSLRAGAETVFRQHLGEMLQEIKPAALTYTDQLAGGGLSFLTHWALELGANVATEFNQVVDLRASEEALWLGLMSSCRRHVTWGRKNITVSVSDGPTSDQALRELRRLHFEAAGRTTRNEATWELQRKMLAANEAFIVSGQLDGKSVSASFFQWSKKDCYYAVSATDRNLFDKPISHILLWEAIRRAKQLGCERFWLGSQVWNGANRFLRPPSQKEVNISKFKRTFGGTSVPQLAVTWSRPAARLARHAEQAARQRSSEEQVVALMPALTEALAKPEWALGRRVLLRPLTPADATERYLSWFRDEDVTEYLDVREITIKQAIDYMERGTATNEYFMCAICDRATGRHIGNLKIGPIRWRHLTSDMVTVIGEKELWGRGMASEAIAMAMRLAFQVLGVRKLHASMHMNNVGSLRAYTRAGWSIEGRIRDQFVHRGTTGDTILICAYNPAFGRISSSEEGSRAMVTAQEAKLRSTT